MQRKWPVLILYLLVSIWIFPVKADALILPNGNPDSAVTSSKSNNTKEHTHGKQATKVVYFISGLAADQRLFHNLALPDYIQKHYLVWIEPKRNESLESYCQHLASQIDTTQKFYLVGVSFGGMVAVELNKLVHPQETILVSSILTANSLSRFFNIVDKLHLHKAMPVWVYKHFYDAAFWFFGAKTDEQRALVVDLMDDASPNLLRWSIDQLISWKNSYTPKNVYVISGTRDRVFPYKRIPADTLITGGSHMMIYNRGPEISQILVKELNKK